MNEELTMFFVYLVSTKIRLSTFYRNILFMNVCRAKQKTLIEIL